MSGAESAPQGESLVDTLDHVRNAATGDEVTIGEIVEELGERGFLPAILLPALIAATPLSGIPGVSVVCGLTIAMLAFELIFGFKHLYLPGKLKKLSIDTDKLHKALKKVTPAMAFIDRHTGNRLTFLFHRPMIWGPQLLILLSGMAMPFLEFIPFSSSVVAIGVSLLVMSMLTRDGVFGMLAAIPYLGLIYLIYRVLG